MEIELVKQLVIKACSTSIAFVTSITYIASTSSIASIATSKTSSMD